jgi:DNA helicase II / ATP-dependent DNA helicase PcrA
MTILDELNSRQRGAATHTDGALLIIAGAGSGKTKTITHRIAHLISTGVAPEKILAVTFTNKAAGELRERVLGLLAKEKIRIAASSLPFMGTFHSLGAFILRAHGSALGIPRHFTILDEEDTRSIFKNIIKGMELDADVFSPLRMRHIISQQKNELISATDYARNRDASHYQETVAEVYAAYEAYLFKTKSLDFDDLLTKTVSLLETSAEAREWYRERWHYIHIDEYQDTNRAQYSLSKILADKYKNIAVVGDVDQAIYSWRGADWRNILQFEQDWPGATVITLEENYRSTEKILEAANAVIVNNKERREKTLRSTKEAGESISLVVLDTERQEALFIATYIQHLVADGTEPGGIAVLFRTNAQSRAIEEAFLKKNIPYRLIAGVKFYERKEVKDLLAYIKYALNPDDLLSRKRILNTPPRGIGKVLTLKYIGGAELDKTGEAKIKKFETIIAHIRASISEKKTSDALSFIMREAGFDDYYKGNKLEVDRLENIKELLSVAKKFDELPASEGIERLITEAALSTQDTEVEDKNKEIILLTAHAAKGLEFDVVIIAGLEEGLFPHSLSEGASELEEERRLFYVALTRARKKIMITLARRRMLYGEVSLNDPSRFLGEIPEHLVDGNLEYNTNTADNEYEDESISPY